MRRNLGKSFFPQINVLSFLHSFSDFAKLFLNILKIFKTDFGDKRLVYKKA